MRNISDLSLCIRYLHGIICLCLMAILTACSAEVSEEIAQTQSNDLVLDQCELAVDGVIGEPIEPVMIDGVATQACSISGTLSKSARLKSTHRYKPLVWVLDGVVEIGDSKVYQSTAEIENETAVKINAGSSVYAKPEAVLVIHRNGLFTGTIRSLDNNNGAENWGGVVINGFGPHKDCPELGNGRVCNIEGPWGYYGGVRSIDEFDIDRWVTRFRGFFGSVVGAGNGPLGASVVQYAPLQGVNDKEKKIFNSVKTALEINGGNAIQSVHGRNNAGHFVHWHNGYSGGLQNSVIYHNNNEFSALKGSGPSTPGLPASLINVTVMGQDFPQVPAIELESGAVLDISNSVVAGLGYCLQINDNLSDASLLNSVFFCDETTSAGRDGTDYAAQVVQDAANFYELDPDLTVALDINNPDIIADEKIGASVPNLSELPEKFDLKWVQPICLGVGTALHETMTIGSTVYHLCQLEGTINKRFDFDDDVNDIPVAWTLKGTVVIGGGNQALNSEQQNELKQNLLRVRINGTSKIFAQEGASLVFSRGVDLKINGSADKPVEISSADEDKQGVGEWGGVIINGFSVTNQCIGYPCNAEQSGAIYGGEFLDDNSVQVSYLRILEAGGNAAAGAIPALTLNGVGSGSLFDNIDIVGSGHQGLVINGGAVNIDHVMISRVAGDQLTWAYGYRGTLQYALLKSDQSNGHALLGRNQSDDMNAIPRSRPAIANITLVGGEAADTAIALEQGSGLLLYNAVVTGFSRCVDIDHAATNELLFSDPLAIYFDGVTLDCTQTAAGDSENSDKDYAAVFEGEYPGVSEASAFLDAQFVPTGLDEPNTDIDLSLVGDAAQYVQADSRYYGAVASAQDKWYLGWSDSLGKLLSVECDLKATLEDEFSLQFLTEVTTEAGVVLRHSGQAGNITVGYKICGLRGTVTEDITLTRYTGEDAELIAVDENQRIAGYISSAGTEVLTEAEHAPIPTVWLINGLVRVGEGHLEITDLAQVEAMKSDPVTLKAEPGTYIMAAGGGGLHITRGGALHIAGDEFLDFYDDSSQQNDSGPVSLFSTEIVTEGESQLLVNLVEFEPYTGGGNVTPWLGLIVDGFGRNNQCPDAMADSGTRICNIEGEHGYYGGYDNDHDNLQINNLYMDAGQVVLNSVGQGGSIQNFMHTGNSKKGELGDDQKGAPVISVDGGAVNFKNIYLKFNVYDWGEMLFWHHGYQGTLQNVHIRGRMSVPEPGVTTLPSIVKGLSGEVGNEDILPRSMPTLANISLRYHKRNFSADSAVESVFFELGQGSGMFLYNSVIGDEIDYTNTTQEQMDYCMKVDLSSEQQVGETIFVNKLFHICKEFSDNPSFYSGLLSLESTDMRRSDYTFSESSTDDYGDLFNILLGWTSYYLPTGEIVTNEKRNIDYSTSLSADIGFIDNTDYVGSFDYFIIRDGGGGVEN
jgi:hypothetical protein